MESALFGPSSMVGYVTILGILNIALIWAMKQLDRGYRDEFLLFRYLRAENEKLQRRVNAIDMIKQGKLVCVYEMLR